VAPGRQHIGLRHRFDSDAPSFHFRSDFGST